MTEVTLAVLGLLVFAWAVVSGVAERRNVTGPMVFTVTGYLLCNSSWGVLALEVETGGVESLVELTLALLLFSDAARVNLNELRREVGLPVRLLGIGLRSPCSPGHALQRSCSRSCPGRWRESWALRWPRPTRRSASA